MLPLFVLLAACATGDSGGRDSDGDSSGADPADTAGDTAMDTADTGGGDTGDSDTGDTAEDPTTLDQDGDGYTPLEGDCDDERAHIYPGAPDHCDGLDQDCDGESIPDHTCGAEWPVDQMWTWEIHGEDDFWLEQVFAGDVTGDGVGDLVASGFDETGELFFGKYGPAMDWPAMDAWGDPAWIDDWPVWNTLSPLPIVDSTGDGIGDQWVLTSATSAGYTGGAFLFPGDPAGFGTASTRIDRAAQAYWLDGGGVSLFADDPRGGVGDLTGDGLADVMLFATDTDGGTQLVTIAGGDSLSGTHVFGSLPRMSWEETGTRSWGELVGDLDGDGLADSAFDLVGVADHPVGFLAGADWTDGGDVAEGMSLAYDGSGDPIGKVSLGWRLGGTPGDVDGDGLDDQLVNTTHPDESVCATVLSGGIPVGDVASWTFARVCVEGVAGWVADVDSDGSSELRTASGTIVPSTLIRGGGTFDADDVSPLRPTPPGSGYNIEATEDLDGDGRPEWVMDDMYFDGSRGRLLIVKGFDIPWDDPTKW